MKLIAAAFICCMFQFGSAADFSTCDRSYTKVGCFKQDETAMDMLVNDRDPRSKYYEGHMLQWGKFSQSIHSLACRCSAKAKLLGYSYIAISFWAECYGGKNLADLDALVKRPDAVSSQCVNHKFKPCDVSASEECVGKAYTEYVYSLNQQAEQSKDGNYTAWSEWTDCSNECGPGTQERERSCTNPEPLGSGADCESLGPATESRSCKIKECPVDGGWSDFGNFGKCSKSCGAGIQTNTRTCTNPKPQFGGKVCTGSSTSSRNCKDKECPINGGWTPYSSYGSCSKTCGSGTQSRSRSCTNPKPQFGGVSCSGSSTSSRSCKDKECPIDGKYSAWGTCTSSCDGGWRSRTCNNPAPQHGGKACQGAAKERCNTKACPVSCSKANWWGSFDKKGWSTCTAGSQYYMRGMWRNDKASGSKDGIHRIEEANCCKRSGSYGSESDDCYSASWWSSFDKKNTWNKCKAGYFMRGLYRSDDNRLHNIEQAKCCKPKSAPTSWGACYSHNVGSSFDNKGWSQCNSGYHLVGLYRGTCDNLYCIEKFYCCKMKLKQ